MCVHIQWCCAQWHNARRVHADAAAGAGDRVDAGVLRRRVGVRGGRRGARDAIARLALVRVPLRAPDATLRVHRLCETSQCTV